MTYEVPHKDYIVMSAKPRNDVKPSTKKFKNTNEVQSLPYVIARSEATWQSVA